MRRIGRLTSGQFSARQALPDLVQSIRTPQATPSPERFFGPQRAKARWRSPTVDFKVGRDVVPQPSSVHDESGLRNARRTIWRRSRVTLAARANDEPCSIGVICGGNAQFTRSVSLPTVGAAGSGETAGNVGFPGDQSSIASACCS